mmetsp:Transcript_7211/g.15232  ORF Transcript_7211/g.15232 Transcript_7211/m.15232 type:complete len:304 (-) Transcript_7211:310-1221(-)
MYTVIFNPTKSLIPATHLIHRPLRSFDGRESDPLVPLIEDRVILPHEHIPQYPLGSRLRDVHPHHREQAYVVRLYHHLPPRNRVLRPVDLERHVRYRRHPLAIDRVLPHDVRLGPHGVGDLPNLRGRTDEEGGAGIDDARRPSGRIPIPDRDAVERDLPVRGPIQVDVFEIPLELVGVVPSYGQFPVSLIPQEEREHRFLDQTLLDGATEPRGPAYSDGLERQTQNPIEMAHHVPHPHPLRVLHLRESLRWNRDVPRQRHRIPREHPRDATGSVLDREIGTVGLVVVRFRRVVLVLADRRVLR